MFKNFEQALESARKIAEQYSRYFITTKEYKALVERPNCLTFDIFIDSFTLGFWQGYKAGKNEAKK